MLDFPPPEIQVYSIETAMAEKFEAIVSLQLQTSRMKDFYDVLFFAEHYKFKKDILLNAILTTFNNRSTALEQRKVIYEDTFKSDDQLQKLWVAFLKRNKLESDNSFPYVANKIHSFIEPVFEKETQVKWNPQTWKWE